MKLNELLTEVKHPSNMGEVEFWRWRDRSDIDPRLSDEQAIAQYDKEQSDAEWEETISRWQQKADSRARYAEQVVAVEEYLSTNKNDFVSSVLNSSRRYGSFTGNQWAAVKKIINQRRSVKAPPEKKSNATGGSSHREVLQALVKAKPDNPVFASALKALDSGPLTADQLKTIRHNMYRTGWKDKAGFMK